jgi:hypothetical protein
MPQLEVIYARARKPGSLLIRYFGLKPWSHVAVVEDEGHVIEAVMLKGVVRTPMVEFLARYDKTERVANECPHPEVALTFARSQIGRGYDWLAAVGTWFGKTLDDGSAWQCAEFKNACLEAGGAHRLRLPSCRLHPSTDYIFI